MAILKRRGKVIIESYDDILTFYVEVVSINPYLIKVSQLDRNLFINANKTILLYDGDKYVFTIKDTSTKEDSVEIIIKDKINVEHYGYESFSVDFKDICTLAQIDNDSIINYKSTVFRINKREANNLGIKLQNILLTEDFENEKLYKYLLEINNKLDELLSYARPKIEVENSFNAKLLSISVDYIIIFSNRLIDCSRHLFFYTSLFDNSNKLAFASIVSPKVMILNNDNTGIYCLEFIDIEEHIKDNIMHFIFSIDRANLKQLNKTL